MRCYSVGSVRRPRGSLRTPVQVTVTTTESQPVAPLGNTPAWLAVWTAPVPSVARTWRACSPDGASQAHTHCRQVSVPSAAASLAVCHGPLSTLTCTREMPRGGAQAPPPARDPPRRELRDGPRHVDPRLGPDRGLPRVAALGPVRLPAGERRHLE